jgi:CPA1 family monovalent cation:H+ antiporter
MLPTAIGMMATVLVISLALVELNTLGLAYGLREYEASLLRSIDFSDVLMQCMLSMLLFAGALHIELSELKACRWQIGGWRCWARCCPRWRSAKAWWRCR